MPEENRLLNLHFENFIKSYSGLLKIDSRIDLTHFNTLCTDSRKINKNDIFLALSGENFDGNEFVNESIEKGCKFFITENPSHINGGILVKSTLEFLEDIAKFLINVNRDIKVFGITGTNGKTTTKELLSLMLSKKFNVLSTKGNFNNLIGLPLTIINLEDKHDVLVLEMGTNSEGEIRKLADIARPGFATITNIGKGHTEKLKNEKKVFQEKKDISFFFDSKSVFAFNFDDEFLRNYSSDINCNKISFGIVNQADLVAKNISTDFSKFNLVFEGKSEEVCLQAPGINNIYNSLCSASLGIMAGLELKEIKAGLEEFAGLDNRFRIIELMNENIIINDTYNANPNSMCSAIEMTTKIFPNKDKVAILGDMLELGAISEIEHIKVGQEIAKNGFKELYAYGPNSENYLKGLGNEVPFFKLSNHSNIKDFIDLDSISNTVILVKGSRGMRMEKIFSSLNI